MNNTILLINPNRYRTPPVIPVGLEYIGWALDRAGWNVRMLDLCFVENPVEATIRALEETRPLFIGITIRNIDSALFHNNIFFLPEIKTIIETVKNVGIPVVLGGVGFSATPEQMLKETSADFGVAGPGETAIVRLAEQIKTGGRPPKITDGWKTGIDTGFSPERPFHLDYKPYIENGGIVGFATQYGCTDNCPYCIEACTPSHFRNPAAVIRELSFLRSKGFDNFHLCDSEFNLDLDFAESFSVKLADAGLNISWAVYMKPVPWSEKLFKELKRSGANVITLSVDSFALSSQNPRYIFKDLESIIRICRDLEIKLAVDLLTGYPDEPVESTAAAFEFFKAHRPDTVGVNAFFRVYPGTELESTISNRPDWKQKLTRIEYGSSLDPVFYNHIPLEKLKELAGGDPLFKIEGFERTTNYERLS